MLMQVATVAIAVMRVEMVAMAVTYHKKPEWVNWMYNAGEQVRWIGKSRLYKNGYHRKCT
jgi:hypothetical protein